jgi:hypothetical protein
MQHYYLVAWQHSSYPQNVRSDVIKLPFNIGGVEDLHAVIDEIVEKHPELKVLGSSPVVLSFSYFGPSNG